MQDYPKDTSRPFYFGDPTVVHTTKQQSLDVGDVNNIICYGRLWLADDYFYGKNTR